MALDFDSARRSYVLAPSSTIEREIKGCSTGSAAWAVLQSALEQCRGDVEAAVGRLKAIRNVSAPIRASVSDLLVPLLISLNRLAEAEQLLGGADEAEPATRVALRAVLHAAEGRAAEVRECRDRIETALPSDQLELLLIGQRLALTAYLLGDTMEAIERARGARARARRLGSARAEAAALTVEYAAVHAGNGDAAGAWRLASAMSELAARGGDRSRRALADVALYELAVERGDLPVCETLARSFSKEPLPAQYKERFTRHFADVCLALLKSADYESAVAQLSAIEATVSDPAERALCKTARALCLAALDDVAAARRDARQGIALTSRPPASLNAGVLRQRRLARAFGIAAGFMIGDVARGRRSLEASFVRKNPEVAAIVRAATAGATGPATIKGYVRVVADAVRHRAQSTTAGPLTATERDVLSLLSSGRSTAEISELRDCSPLTVRTHVRNAIAKLGARGRVDAVTRARNLGLLDSRIYALNNDHTHM